MEQEFKQSRRRHRKELKRQVLAECAEPVASVADVALSHGLNVNLVQKWRRLGEHGARGNAPKDVFVPVVVASSQASAAADIRIDLRRGATAINVTWPLCAAECAGWMREIMR